MEYNVYCDESCHLERDGHKVMVLGAVWCPSDLSRHIFRRFREIKRRATGKEAFEVKWSKVSPAKTQFYLDLIDYFFDDDNLHFRALVVSDKTMLDHTRFSQDHDTWYFKMYFDMLKTILNPSDRYSIYLDIKDTQSGAKISKLREVLSNNMYDFSRSIIKRIQTVRSHEVELVQLADLLSGAISYENRGLRSSEAKVELVSRIKYRSGYSLKQTTLLREGKLNLFVWHPEEGSR
jgi:hypothetical protein